jgi:PAS domain S-box-containing protein
MTRATNTVGTIPLLDLLFENAGAGLCLVAPDGTILRANADWLRTTGFSDDVVGEDFVELFPGTRDLAIALHARVRAGHHVEVPRHAVSLNGRETWWEGSIDPVPMEGGTGLLITAREVRAGREEPPDVVMSRLVQDVIDGAPSIIFVKDVEGRFLTINRRLEELLGTTREALRGKTDHDIFPREVADRYRENDRRVIETGRLLQIEEVAELADGKRHLFLANKFPVYDDAGRLVGTCGISHDITDRADALRALRESEERYRSLFEMMTEGFALGEAICDADGVPRDFRFLEMNAAFERQSGLAIETTRGRPMREVLPQLEQSWVDTYCAVALRREPARRFESYNRDLDRHFEVYCFSPAPGRFGILFTDVSERKRAIEAIRQNEARLRRLYESGLIGVLHFDLDGGIGDANDRFLEMVGYDREDLRAGRVSWERMTPAEYRDADAHAIAELKRTGVDTPYEKEFIRKDGSRVAVLIGAATYDDARHRGIAFVVDVTDRRHAERALRDADRRKDEFLGMLSHELRNPLAPIRNASFILGRAEATSDAARRAREVIERQTEHITHLVDDLLDVTRIARGKIELRRAAVNLRELALRVAEDFRPVMEEKGITLRAELPDGRVVADVDPVRVTQVVGNLLHNATKFTRPGDAVTLALSVDGGEAVITVRDTGAGIDPALLPTVFDPFVQGERTLARSEGGLGLGLALVKGITELHGGRVGLTSAGRGQGCEFVVRLPLRGDRGRAPRAGASDPPRARGRTRSVLVVDDNRDAADTLADLVQVLGHEAVVAYDGPGALKLARERPPDVVLCDIGLPGMNGYELAKALRQERIGAQLIAVSGYAQPEDVKRASEAGFDGHLAKPVRPEEIERLLS